MENIIPEVGLHSAEPENDLHFQLLPSETGTRTPPQALTAMSDRLRPRGVKVLCDWETTRFFFERSEDVRRNVHVGFDRFLQCRAGTRCTIRRTLYTSSRAVDAHSS